MADFYCTRITHARHISPLPSLTEERTRTDRGARAGRGAFWKMFWLMSEIALTLCAAHRLTRINTGRNQPEITARR